ncbi:unnamed protein product [Rotaria sordida]|uniref:Uncharacterized protein n=1 Tax=Rotaria sordida TaxID=392033 RepID=A0A814RY54_9BILA|nr:unnamed protein product [Rotaria sordida]CAF1138994.1 unnamed protein product [Rotaria sordida]CAF3877158.1 unnamed protein product [Rotaria sordida]CAF3897759.1 unnamed protein product [Rotaria sordida]
MSIGRNITPQSTTSRRNRWDPLSDSERHKFRVQSAPPLSLRQFLRSTITVIPGGKHWQPAGIYRASVVYEEQPPNHLPEIVVKPQKNSRPAWCPPGPTKYKRPKSPTAANKRQKSKDVTNDSQSNTNSDLRSKATRKLVTPWHPSGNPYYKPVPYFDPPSLRWSSQQIKQSMPEFKPTIKNSPMNPK